MAINWNLFPQALQNEREGINKTFDWSFVTPEVVKGFTRYQALRPEQEVREAQAVEEAKKGIEDEIKRRRAQQWRTKWEADRAAEELQKDIDSGDMYDTQGLIDWAKEKGAKKFNVPENIRTTTGNFWKDSNVKVDPGLVETELLPPDDPGMTDEERAELETEILKERLGDNYDSYMKSYGIYGGLNPYEQMIQAGKRSSYWDPEIGKIYTDAGEKIRQNNLDIWRAAQENKLNLLKLAQQRLNSDWARPSDLTTIRTLESELAELAKNDPRNGGYLTVKDGSNKTLDDYKKQNANLSDNQGNTVNEDVFFAKLQRGDVYKSLDDLRADPFYKTSSPEIKTLLEREWTKNRNAFMKSYNERNTIAVDAASKTPYGDELKETEKLLRELKNIDFDATGDGKDGYKALQILKVLDNAGYKVSQVLNTDPTFQNLRATIKGAKNKSWDELIKSAPEIGSQVLESFAKTVFPMLRDQNIWEDNSGAITNFGKLLRDDVERRYNEARKGARSMITGWEGTSLDPDYDNWYKTGTGWESGRAKTDKKEEGADDKKDGAAETGADDKKDEKKEEHSFAGQVIGGSVDIPSKDNIFGDAEVVNFILNTKLSKPKYGTNSKGQPEFTAVGKNFINKITWDSVAKIWNTTKIPKNPVKPTNPVNPPVNPTNPPANPQVPSNPPAKREW